jgi:hypothetical protein
LFDIIDFNPIIILGHRFVIFLFFICSSKKASEHQNDHVTVYSRNKVGKSSTVFFQKLLKDVGDDN